MKKSIILGVYTIIRYFTIEQQEFNPRKRTTHFDGGRIKDTFRHVKPIFFRGVVMQLKKDKNGKTIILLHVHLMRNPEQHFVIKCLGNLPQTWLFQSTASLVNFRHFSYSNRHAQNFVWQSRRNQC